MYSVGDTVTLKKYKELVAIDSSLRFFKESYLFAENTFKITEIGKEGALYGGEYFILDLPDFYWWFTSNCFESKNRWQLLEIKKPVDINQPAVKNNG